MRLIVMLLTIASLATTQPVQDPARLEVTVAGDSLSYKVINQLPYRIVGFEIYTQFTSGGFENMGCMVNAEVKSPKDLSLTGVCRVPHDPSTGGLISYSTRIVHVKFVGGLTWTPSESEKN